MKYTFKKGNHRPNKLTFGLFVNKKSVVRDVIFHDSCRYYLAGEDQYDVNKLFGLGYLWHHHTDRPSSIRLCRWEES
jgi:hypothetical protein